MKFGKTILSFLLAGVLSFGLTTPVLAAFQTEITNENSVSTAEVLTKAEKNSTFTVGLPVLAELGPTTGKGFFEINIKGDIDSGHRLIVKPVDKYTTEDGDTTNDYNFLLKHQPIAGSTQKTDVVVSITPQRTEFYCDEISLSTPIVSKATLQSSKVLAGKWKGIIEYHVGLEEFDGVIPEREITNPAPGLYTDDTYRTLVKSWDELIDEGILDITQQTENGNTYYILNTVGSYQMIEDMPVHRQTNNLNGVLIIADNIHAINEEAFAGCNKLTGIVLPTSLLSVGPLAFGACTSLNNVTLPENIIYIGEGAFAFCTNLDINISENVQIVGQFAFLNVPHVTYNGSLNIMNWGALSYN